LIANLRRRFEEGRWGFGPIRRELKSSLGSGWARAYSDCGEDILELVDESDETGVVDVDATVCTGQKVFMNGDSYLLNPTYADAFVAMFGE
jgi:hypothetical protein